MEDEKPLTVSDEPPKKKLGRRSNFYIDDEILKEIEAFSNRGMNQKNLQDYYGVSKSAWNRKCKAKPELLKAYNRGKARGVAFVSGKLMELVKKGNLTAIMYYLSRIAKWTENPEVEDIEDGDSSFKPIIFAATDPIEAARIYQKIMQGSKKHE